MPKFNPTHAFMLQQGGLHRMQKGVIVEYPEGHAMTIRLRAMGPAYAVEEKAEKVAPPPPPPPKATIQPKATKKAKKVKGGHK